MGKVKITKRTLLRHDNNCMVTNWFYLVNGRAYTDDGERYQKFRFVVWIDAGDLYELDCESVDEYLNYYAIPSFTDYIPEHLTDSAQLDTFIEVCNDSIHWWNDHNRCA